MPQPTINKRKNNHLNITLNNAIDFRSKQLNGLNQFQLECDSLPEINRTDVDCSFKFFEKSFSAPFFIGSMTGGTTKTDKINKILIDAASETKIGFCFGSQRIAIEKTSSKNSFILKNNIPPFVFGNIGAVQLNDKNFIEKAILFIKNSNLNGLFIHLNALQECIQPEGNTDFSNLSKKINQICNEIKIPIFIKEVGTGISEKTAKKLAQLNIAGIEVAGFGGTNWCLIESKRTLLKSQQQLGELFSEWGTNTADSIINTKKHIKSMPLIASGGISNGIEIAKSIALGADAVSIARPFLIEAKKSKNALIEKIEQLKLELKTAMFLTGSKNLNELKQVKIISRLNHGR